MLPSRPKGANVTVAEKDAASLVSNPGFDKEKVTVFYMHGYTEEPSSESIEVVSDGKFIHARCLFSAFPLKNE